MLLTIAGVGLLTLLIYLIIFCVVLWLFYYVIQNLAPEPFRRILTVVLVVVGVIFLLYFLLGLVGQAPNLRL